MDSQNHSVWSSSAVSVGKVTPPTHTVSSHHLPFANTTFFDVTPDDVTTNVSDVNSTDAAAAFPVPQLSRLNEVTMAMIVYFLPLVFTFGIVGNSVSFVVFLSEKMRRVSTNVYLAALSASSWVFLVAVAVSWTDVVGLKLMHRAGICQATVYLTYCSDFLSVWLVVCIAVENFVINFFLHRASSYCTIRRALSFVVVLCVTGLLLYNFAIWTSGVISINGSDNHYCHIHPQYRPVVEFYTLVDTGVTLIVPSVVILVLVVPTCVKNISCRSRPGAAVVAASVLLSRRERARLRVTRLLCVIIVSHVLLTAPSHVNKLRHLLSEGGGGGGGEGGGGGRTDVVVVLLVQTPYHLSFSMNFVYYLLWGKNFRDVSLRRKLSPTRGQDTSYAQVTCKALGAYYVQHVARCLVRRDG